MSRQQRTVLLILPILWSFHHRPLSPHCPTMTNQHPLSNSPDQWACSATPSSISSLGSSAVTGTTGRVGNQQQQQPFSHHQLSTNPFINKQWSPSRLEFFIDAGLSAFLFFRLLTPDSDVCLLPSSSPPPTSSSHPISPRFMR
ncbi:uncharacterized protein BO80DRAFT_256882 [Aspergillus ibericus CBS 121593]|uniref:Uncharacterized protein n=1 Tax=Aspergillus ibericus CBS 121593 TaxID=1448316 RepID=A0A395H8Z6_9EURO|nr:hypothetical protein BO80DRAFT_256882 [Aspergillus ibericus CBS 121593]RAL04150.1 hypothetical protein BO80DRAFT_256882 [Aspergillus ibericus CBS 121593]